MRRYKSKRIPREWSAGLAYVVGLIATDGNLSPDRRHINITSKDIEMVETVKKLLALESTIGRKARGGESEKKYFCLQFSDTQFYDFLISVGLTPAKSKTLGKLEIPPNYFPDFLRGCIDGDGSIGGFMHPESSLLQFKVRLVSASPLFLVWILETVREKLGTTGGSIHTTTKDSVSHLCFGKGDSRKLLEFMYYKNSLPALSRKRRVAQKLLAGN